MLFRSEELAEPIIKEVVVPRRQYEKGIAVKGIDNVMIRLAKCCNPVHGDNIVGYITRGRGVSIHRSDCSSLKDVSVENHRFIEVSWTEEPKASYQAGIYVIARDRHSVLAEVTMAIADMKIAITAVNAKTDKNKRAHINLTLQITDTLQLEKVMRQLKKLSDIIDVSRMKM